MLDPPKETALDRALGLACALTVVFTLLACLPSLLVPVGLAGEGDALEYHVPILRWMLRHHAYPDWRWTFVDDYPLLGELLMLPFAAVKTELARLVPIAGYFGSAAFGAGVGVELSRARERSPLFWFLFAGLLGLHPLVTQATLLMVDNLAAAFTLGALYYLLRRRYDRSAFFLAAALATRYSVWAAGPGALLALWRFEGALAPRARARLLLRYAAIAALGAAPFMARNLLLNGNPFFPLLEGIFHGHAVEVFGGYGRGTGFVSLFLFPYDLLITNSFTRSIFDNQPDPFAFYGYHLSALFHLQLTAALAGLALAPRAGGKGLVRASRDFRLQACALFFAPTFLAWWFGSQQLRFLGAPLAVGNALLLAAAFRFLPRWVLVPLALLPMLGVAWVEREAWQVAAGNAVPFGKSAYVQRARDCFARAAVTDNSVVGYHDRSGLAGVFDFEFVFLPGTNLYSASPGGYPPSPDFIYSGYDFRPVPGYEEWPRERPCVLRRVPAP